jgi:purine-binding chemotaxis protein CheW
MQMISFSLGEGEFGVDIKRVKEVIRIGEITHMPRAPDFLKGVINLRGEVIPVIDLRERFGLPTQAATDKSRLIVVEIEQKSVGMVVDEVSDVMRVVQADIDASPFWREWLTRQYVYSVARVNGQLIVLMDVDAVLIPDELKDLDMSIQTAESVPETKARNELYRAGAVGR